jgi:hypothetical protein
MRFRRSLGFVIIALLACLPGLAGSPTPAAGAVRVLAYDGFDKCGAPSESDLDTDRTPVSGPPTVRVLVGFLVCSGGRTPRVFGS